MKEPALTLKEAIARLEKTEAELCETRAALRHRDEQLAFFMGLKKRAPRQTLDEIIEDARREERNANRRKKPQ